MAHPWMTLPTLFAPAAILLACSSGGSTATGTGGAGTGTGGSKTTATASSTGAAGGSTTTATSSSAGTGGSAGDGGVMACEAACVANQMSAYAKFATYQIASCGCASGAPCESSCTSACTSGGTASNTCISCLLTEAEKGGASTCTQSAEASCEADPACQAFTTCVDGC